MIARYAPGKANSTAKNPKMNPYTATESQCGVWLVGTGKVVEVGVEVTVRRVAAARESVWLSSEAAMISTCAGTQNSVRAIRIAEWKNDRI